MAGCITSKHFTLGIMGTVKQKHDVVYLGGMDASSS